MTACGPAIWAAKDSRRFAVVFAYGSTGAKEKQSKEEAVMKKGYWIAIALVLVLALGLFAAACGTTEETTTTAAPSTETTVANTSPLKIGIAISLTGDSAAPCQQIKQAFDTEAKYINANGGIKGRQVALTYVDDQSKMDTAVAAIQSLVDQKMDVIIGPFPQWTQAPTRQITEDAGILHIAFGPPTLEELNTDQSGWTYYFLPATGADGCADAFLREMQADGKKNVLGVGDQMVISQETLKVLNTSLPASGITFTLMSDSWGLGETDVTPMANKIAAKAKEVNPDAIILASNPVHVNQMTKILRSLGITAPIYNQASGAHPLVMLAPAGNDPANVKGDYAFGPAIVNPAAIPDDYPAKADLVAFIARWQADNPKEPFASLFLGFGYDTIHLAQQAIESAATQDEKGWADAMTKVDWWGAQGHYQFSTTDHVGNHGGFMQWQYGDGFVFVRDLNSLTQPTLLPATTDAMAKTK
jgi:branched-chain amino acid transport system substrate-binding protein